MQGVTVIIDAKLMSASNVPTQTCVTSAKTFRALNVFAEFRVWKSQIGSCRVHEIAQTSHDASIVE
jgi:hypothetical protein